ncbi:MAG: M56 family metallopeptidase [Gemmatimonadaceae bacterium]
MIAEWMLFTLEISVLFFVAAWLAERALNAARRPVRWGWMTAMIATALLPLTALFAPVPQLAIPDLLAASKTLPDSATPMMPGFNPKRKESVASAPTEVRARNTFGSPNAKSADSLVGIAASDKAVTPVSRSAQSNASIASPDNEVKTNAWKSLGIPMLPASLASQLEIAPNSTFQRLNSSLLKAWLVIAAIGSLICLIAVARTMRQRGTWSGEYVDGTPVLVTHDVGPALIGVLQYSIVIPRWVCSLEERARKLILAHEREHARSYDPILLALGVFLVVVAPWNVVNWFMLRRLRLAIEMDCDQRVLRAHPDARSYSSLLLDVAERTLPSVMPQAALVEYGTSLETRIRAMISPSAQHRALRVGGNLLAMGALVAVACVTPRPYASSPPAERVARLKSDLADAERSLPKTRASDMNTLAMIAAQHETSLKATNLKLHDASDSAVMTNAKQSDSLDVISRYSAAARNTNRVDSTKTSTVDRPNALVASRYSESDAINSMVLAGILNEEPQTLAQWPRQDSTLVVILDTDGHMLKTFASARYRGMSEYSANRILGGIYFPTAFNFFDTTGTMSIKEAVDGRELDVPLHVVWAQLKPATDPPRTRDEIIPSEGTMLATIRSTEPQLFLDSTNDNPTGLLLYDTNGNLISTANARITEPRILPDGTEKPKYDEELFRRFFGSLMDGGVAFNSGARSYYNKSPKKGATMRVLYSVIGREAEFGRQYNPPKTRREDPDAGITVSGFVSGSSSRSSYPNAVNRDMHNKIFRILNTHAMQGLNDWDREHNSMALIVDANDTFLSYGYAPLAQNARWLYLLDFFGNRVGRSVRIDDIETVGVENYVSNMGAPLDHPLQVVWARLKRGAKPKN